LKGENAKIYRGNHFFSISQKNKPQLKNNDAQLCEMRNNGGFIVIFHLQGFGFSLQ